MLKRLLLLLLITTGLAFGQSTTVNLNVTEVGGQPWINGTYSVIIVMSPSVFNSSYGGPFRNATTGSLVTSSVNGNLDGTGSATFFLIPNASITPSVNLWSFTVCPSVGAGCFTQSVTIAGASQSVNLTPPTLSIIANPPFATAYTDSEVLGAVGQVYWNVLSQTHRVCVTLPCASNWQNMFRASGSPTLNRYLKGDGTQFVTSNGPASGTGSCSASTWTSTLNSDAAPTCTQPAFSNISGTLTTGQEPATTVNAITNDTNVTGSITSQNLSLGWTGTLAAGRLNSNVVQGITNDTNVTGSISAQNLTLGWTGTLAKGRTLGTTVYTDQANTWGAFVQTFQSGANFLFADPTTSTKKAQFDLSNITAANTRTINIPDANSTTVQAKASVGSQWLNSMSAQGVFTSTQPAASDLSNGTTGSGAVVLSTSPTINTSLTSGTANPATAGFFRLASGDSLQWRNNGNTANITLNKDSSDIVHLNTGFQIDGTASTIPFFIQSAATPATNQVTIKDSTGLGRFEIDSNYHPLISSSTGNGVQQYMRYLGTPTVGAGGAFLFEAPNALGVVKDAVIIDGGLTTLTSGAENGDFDIALYTNGSSNGGISITGSTTGTIVQPFATGTSHLGKAGLGWLDARFEGTNPLVMFRNTAATLPNGLHRIIETGNDFIINRNTAAGGDFSTNTNDLILAGVTGDVQIGTGVGPDGGGFKHKRFGASCTTGAAIGSTCTTTYSWTTAFADTSYTPVCWGQAGSNFPILYMSTFTASGVTITVAAMTAAAAQFGSVECIAAHD